MRLSSPPAPRRRAELPGSLQMPEETQPLGSCPVTIRNPLLWFQTSSRGKRRKREDAENARDLNLGVLSEGSGTALARTPQRPDDILRRGGDKPPDEGSLAPAVSFCRKGRSDLLP